MSDATPRLPKVVLASENGRSWSACLVRLYDRTAHDVPLEALEVDPMEIAEFNCAIEGPLEAGY
jgi:hypothetical protein